MAEAGEMPVLDLFIDGHPTPPVAGNRFPTRNPYTRETWAVAADGDGEDAARAVASAKAALEGPWGSTTPRERADLMRRLADLVERDADRLAELETRDNGKLLRETSGQMAVLPEWLRYFAGVAETNEGSVIPTGKPNYLVYTRNEPVGVVAAITPWNSPLLLLVFKLAPALAAGCTLVIKPSDHTPASTLELAALAAEAGFPAGVVNVVTGAGAEVGEALVSHPDVAKVAFTGSTATGIQVARGAAGHLARTTLELGGKSAQLVFADADLEAAANGVVAGVFAATGQTCIAGSRLLVEPTVKDELLERLASRAARIRLGDPMDLATEMGPLANETQLSTVRGFVEEAVGGGATVVCGGAEGDSGGLFWKPTILADVDPGASVVAEEVFGPVLVVDTFEHEEEAVRKANASRYGLAAGIWTSDVQRAHRVAARLRAGNVWVNAYRVLAPEVPFGGMGASGIGRENGRRAIDSYTETKAVWVELSGQTRDPFSLG